MDEYVVKKGPHYLVEWGAYYSVWRSNRYYAKRLLHDEAILFVVADLLEAEIELVTNVS